MIILHPFAPQSREADQNPCWQALEKIRRQGKHIVIDVPCYTKNTYEDALKLVWGLGLDIVIIEHDIALIHQMIDELDACDEFVCAQAYLLHPATTRLREDVFAHRKETYSGTTWIREGASQADRFGFGLTKISAEAQKYVKPHMWETGDWHDLDSRVSEAFLNRGIQAHVHWPAVEHFHREAD